MIKRNLIISLLLVVALCVALTPGLVMAGTTDTGTGSGTLSEINEIDATDAAIAFGTITATTGDNAIDNSGTDVLTFSTLNSNTPVWWKAEVTGATKPTGAQANEATVKGYIYWSETSGDAVYPAFIDVNVGGATGCTISEAWAAHTADIPSGGGSETKSAEFTVSFHAWADSTGTAASSNTFRVVFTDSSKVFVKDGGSDWDFTSDSADLDSDATALEINSGAGKTNFVTGVIGGTNAVYTLVTLVTTASSEQVLFQLGKKFGFTASAQTQDFYALVDMPNLAAAGDYTWTITLTTAKWNIN
jgi:hypothetical protein